MLGQKVLLRLMRSLHLPWGAESCECIGLYPSDDTVYITVFRKQSPEEMVVKYNEKINHAFIDGETDVLCKYIKDSNLSHTPAFLILPKKYYDVFILDDFLKNLTDKSGAVKWRLAEYLDYPCEEAIVDYMALPRKNDSEGKMYALAMRETVLKSCMHWAKKNNIYLQGIDIWQNAIKNTIEAQEQDKGSVIIQIGKQKSELVIIKQDIIFFMRDINVLRDSFIEEDLDKLNETYEFLSVEIQRSIDYCVSHIKNPGITRVNINPDITDVLDKNKLEAILGMKVDVLTLPQLNNIQKDLTMPQLIAGSAALGGWR